MKKVRALAAGQTVPVRGDVRANLEEHIRLAEVAAAAGASVLVFPELSLTGYEMDLAEALSFVPDDDRLSPLVEAAVVRGMTLVVGAPVRLDGRLHIGALILSPDGSVGVYTKHHLGAFSESARVDGEVPPAEATYFLPGKRNPLVSLGGQDAAIAVCADIGRASHPRQASERGASTYLASMFVIPSELAAETTKLGAYARRYSMAVVFSNFGGPSGGLASAGQSAIWSERGDLVCRLDRRGAGVVIALETSSGWRGRAIPVSDPGADRPA